MRKLTKIKILVIMLFIGSVHGEKLNHLIEFFSFTCSHCIKAEPLLLQVLNKTQAQYMPVVMVQSGDQVGTAMVYYACIKLGCGWQFRNTYFKAVINGAQPYTTNTLVYVLGQVTDKPNDVLNYAKSPEIQQKYVLDQQLVEKYKVNSTPTWVINNQYKVEGEDAILGFMKE
jgi:protein-disulfide isomerase